jgi:hypothetical protein
MTAFFVPGSADAGQPGADEAAYRRLAEIAGAVPAEPGRRIRLVAYRVGRESWTAEVGRKLSGTRPEHRRRKGEFTTTTEKLSGSSTVLAIFAGTPFTIVTDGDGDGDGDGATVDKPSRVVYFAD